MEKLHKFLVCLVTVVLLLTNLPAYASEKVLLDFNAPGASGQNFPGWTWTLTANYANPGWIFVAPTPWPRLFMKGDYGNRSLAAIDTTMRAPSTSSGASLKIYDASSGGITTGSIPLGSSKLTVSNPTGYRVGDYVLISGMKGSTRAGAVMIDAISSNVFTLHEVCSSGTSCVGLSNVAVKPPMQPSYWSWYNSSAMLTSGHATASNDRFSMYVYIKGYPTYTGGDPSNSFEWGTYNCWPNGGYGGGSCPTEANNQHYYHTLNINPGAWVHILWDKHPSHQRGVSSAVPNNPTMLVSPGKDYFETMNSFYLQTTKFANEKNAAFWVDEMKFTSAADKGEPNQNDMSITNSYVGYWASDDHWEIGWDDLSDLTNHDSEYEIRWSTSPITNANYTNANIVAPLDYTVNGNHIHKANTWKYQLWTRFKLPKETAVNNMIYFAIKDVSVAGGLYRNSPSRYIHTIDYHLRANTVPSPPPNLRVS